LDAVNGISTGQTPILWKTYDITGISWPGPATGFVVDLPNETVAVNKVCGLSVTVLNSGGGVYSPGSNTYSVYYFYNVAHSCFSLSFDITGPSIDTVTVNAVIFYTV
jgi:hypothetical protein